MLIPHFAALFLVRVNKFLTFLFVKGERKCRFQLGNNHS